MSQAAPLTPPAAPALTPTDVTIAYRLLFNREPESEAVIAGHIAAFPDMKTFRMALMKSAEFREKTEALLGAQSTTKPLDWPAIRVDTDVSPTALAEMVRLVEGNWDALGRSEPHWSVLTKDEFKADSIAASRDSFFRTGRIAADEALAMLRRNGADLASLDTCLELGCGVGRVTMSLAERFRHVVGVDISRPHLDLAEQAAREMGRDNITFVHAGTLEALRAVAGFDFLYSVIVLQHNPPPVICAILDILLGKLNPGGIALFQLPTYCRDYSFIAEEYLRKATIRGAMEVHVVPQQVLYGLFVRHRCRLLEVREDSWTGSFRFISNTFVIQKAG